MPSSASEIMIISPPDMQYNNPNTTRKLHSMQPIAQVHDYDIY